LAEPFHSESRESEFNVPASTTTIASQSQSPLFPPGTAAAAAARGLVPWDRHGADPGSVDVGLDEGLGLKQRKENE